MSLKIFSIKFFLLILIFLKVVCHQENLTKKNSHIYLNYTSYFINSTIRTLSDKNFDTIISLNNNKSYDYVILFTLRRCPNCNHVMKITENVEKYFSEKNPKIKFYKVDCFLSQWTAMRFNAFKIPVYVYIKQGFYASFSQNNYTEDDLINFIEDENKEFLIYPGKIGYIDVCRKIVHNITLQIQKKIVFWNDFCTLIIIIGTFLGFLYFEIKIYKAGCCGNKNKNKNVHNIQQNKNVKDIKSREKSKNEKDKLPRKKYKDD